MSPDRVHELRRQRDAVQVHLDWLNAEIARESSAAAEPPNVAPKPASSIPAIEVPALHAPIDYEPDPVSAAADARKGCLIWSLALVLVGIVLIAAIYFWRYRDHPMLSAPDRDAVRITVSDSA